MESFATLLLVGLLATSTLVAADSRVTGGSNAPQGKFPYLAIIRDHNEYQCGASIISKKHLLTAAHCVYELYAGRIEVVVGTNNFSGEGGQKYYADEITVHEEHRRMREGYSLNDIAIIRLIREIEFNDKVQPVKLPKAGAKVEEETKVILAGFGRMQRSSPHPSVLQYVNNQILNHTTCGLKWLSWRLILIEASMICTKETQGIGACLGDSGSPLVTDDNVQLGIVSFGEPCGRGVPDVYTNVAYFADWIAQFLNA